MSRDSDRRSSEGAVPLGAFIPLLIVVLTLLIQVFFQNGQLRAERASLNSQWAQQRSPLEEGEKLRAQLESIAGATAVLAEQGNENAAAMRDQLAAQGVTIRPPQ